MALSSILYLPSLLIDSESLARCTTIPEKEREIEEVQKEKEHEHIQLLDLSEETAMSSEEIEHINQQSKCCSGKCPIM